MWWVWNVLDDVGLLIGIVLLVPIASVALGVRIVGVVCGQAGECNDCRTACEERT